MYVRTSFLIFSSVGHACRCAATVTLTTAAPRYRICHGTTTLGRNRRWDNYSIRRQVVSHGPFLRPDPPPARNRPAAFVDRTTAVTRFVPSTRRRTPIPRLRCASFDRSSKRGVIHPLWLRRMPPRTRSGSCHHPGNANWSRRTSNRPSCYVLGLPRRSRHSWSW